MRSAYGLAAMWRRANSAWVGEISQLVIRPPGASPAAMDRAEYPPKVPISSTDRAPRAKVNISRNRPSRRPTIMPGDCSVARRSVANASRNSGGAVVCSVAYDSTSGSTMSVMDAS